MAMAVLAPPGTPILSLSKITAFALKDPVKSLLSLYHCAYWCVADALILVLGLFFLGEDSCDFSADCRWMLFRLEIKLPQVVCIFSRLFAD